MTKSIKLLAAFLLLSSVFNSNCIDFSSPKRMAKRSARAIAGWVNNHRMQTAIGSASVAGATALVSKYGKDHVLIGAAVIGATYAGNGIRHWWQLRTIDNRLDKARKDDPNCFLYAIWRESQWPTAFDIVADKRTVKGQLKQDAQSGVFSPGGSRAKTLSQVRNALNTEKRQLEEWMRTVGALTNAPKCIVDMSRALNSGAYQSFINGLAVQPDTEKVFKCVQHNGMWNAFSNAAFNGCKARLDARMAHASSLLHAPSWDPMDWAIAPCATKATNLYWDLFKAYVRLNALKTLLEEKDEVDKAEQLLNEAKSELDEMIGAQPNAYRTSDNKKQQIVRLAAVQDKIKTLQTHYRSNADILRKLTPIASQLSAINTSLLRQEVLAYPDLLTDDPVKGFLQAVKGMVETLLETIRE